MLRVLGSRLMQAALVMLVVTAVAFVMFRYVGDPVSIMAREDATQAEKAEMRVALGLDQPVVVQFARFVGRRDREVDEDRARRRGACGLADYAMDGIRVADPLARTGVAVPPDQAWG
jgi:hypothetical protein